MVIPLWLVALVLRIQSYRHPSEGWGPCLSRPERSSNISRNMDASRRWH